MKTRTYNGNTSPARIFLTGIIFVAAYFTTITVNAQTNAAPPDVIQLNEGDYSVMTGEIVDADENWIMINSAGKEMKIVLDKLNLKAEADEVFQKGMSVTVEGKITGDDFGVPLVRARSVTATEGALNPIVYEDRAKAR